MWIGNKNQASSEMKSHLFFLEKPIDVADALPFRPQSPLAAVIEICLQLSLKIVLFLIFPDCLVRQHLYLNTLVLLALLI